MDQFGRRTAENRSCRVVAASICCERFGETPIIIRNISSKGVGARIRAGQLRVGERVTLMVRGRILHGEVRWTRGDQFGVELDEEVDPSIFLVGQASANDLQRPFARSHVYDQFKPVVDGRRPGLKTR
jgi:hypothetical protein